MWLDDYELAPAPRRVSPLVSAHVLFGGALQQCGWGVLAFGLALAGVFLALADVEGALRFAGGAIQTQGVVTAVEETHVEVNEQEVWEVAFRFPLEGRTIDGRCYTTDPADVGRQVTVEYVPGQPELCRILGTTRRPLPGWVALFVLAFPAVGLLLVGIGLRKGARGLALLRRGRLALGDLVRTEATNVEINRRPVMALTFAFEAGVDGRRYEVTTRTHEPEALQDEARERILYDPLRPERAVVLDDLPGSGRVTEAGEVTHFDARGLRRLILPGLAAAAAALAAFLTLGNPFGY